MKLTIAKHIHSHLREAIVSGKLQPGYMLSEQTLADEYSSSKMPVREALHQLCQEGYLVSYPRRGYVVSNITEEDFLEVQQVRRSLEMLSIELVVQRASDDEIRGLSKILHDPDPEGGTSSGIAHHAVINNRFHLELARLAKNKRLYDSLNHLLGEVIRAGFRFFSLSSLENRHFHERIIEALLDRDAEKAKGVLREDLEFRF